MLSFGQQFCARIVFLALVICMLILLARLFDLQCLRFEKYRDSALQQQRSIRDVSARRGKVCDRNGVVFAITSTRPAVWADPGLV